MSRVDAKYLELLRTRYATASKKEKGLILDEFVKTTGCVKRQLEDFVGHSRLASDRRPSIEKYQHSDKYR